jgi:hypothetical protein
MNGEIALGTPVTVDGRPGAYEGRNASAVRVRWPNGASEWVPTANVVIGSEAPPPSSEPDPFDGLTAQLEGVLVRLQKDYEAAQQRQSRRKDQMRRLQAVLRTLRKSAEPRVAGKKREWTPEQREAAAERMRARNAERKTQEDAA